MQARTSEDQLQKALVLGNTRIAKHTYHLKIQSDDFTKMAYCPGFTLDLYLGNPVLQPGTGHRKYSFWNYEPVHHIADIAVCTFSKGAGAQWIRTVKKGDLLYFNPPRGKLLADHHAGNYLLIGDITSLSHLYEINRNLQVGKSVFSYIYTQHPEDIFPDLDRSFPFNYHIFSTPSPDEIAAEVIAQLPALHEDTIAYILGEPAVCITLHNYLKNSRGFPLAQLKTKPFWKQAGIQDSKRDIAAQ